MDIKAIPTTDLLALVTEKNPKHPGRKSAREPHSVTMARWVDRNRRRAEILAEAVSCGRVSSHDEVAQLAWKLKLKMDRVQILIASPQIQALAKPRIRARAVIEVAAAIPAMSDAAKKGDTQAFQALSKVAEMVQGGVNVQTNVAMIDQRRGQDPEQVQAFIERFRKAQRKTLDRSVEEAS